MNGGFIINNLTGKGLAKFAISKLGVPYIYGAKGTIMTNEMFEDLIERYPSVYTESYINKSKKNVGKVCCDCSGLISWYTGKMLGSSGLYQSATSRIEISNNMPVGTVLWRSGHVGVYIGNGYVVAAEGVSQGCIKYTLNPAKWSYGLLFDWMEYEEPVSANPYAEPAKNIKRNDTGHAVRWVQYELQKAGFNKRFRYNDTFYNGVVVDGVFGKITDAAVRSFQERCGIQVDGIVGKNTRLKLKQYQGNS